MRGSIVSESIEPLSAGDQARGTPESLRWPTRCSRCVASPSSGAGSPAAAYRARRRDDQQLCSARIQATLTRLREPGPVADTRERPRHRERSRAVVAQLQRVAVLSPANALSAEMNTTAGVGGGGPDAGAARQDSSRLGPLFRHRAIGWRTLRPRRRASAIIPRAADRGHDHHHQDSQRERQSGPHPCLLESNFRDRSTAAVTSYSAPALKPGLEPRSQQTHRASKRRSIEPTHEVRRPRTHPHGPRHHPVGPATDSWILQTAPARAGGAWVLPAGTQPVNRQA